MNRLIQHINADYSNGIVIDMYCYGEASFEANQAMQEPLEKLYKLENQPDMREKVREYISELDAEIDRCYKLAEQNMNDEATTIAEMMVVRVQVLTEVKNDLESRLEELV